jgi:crotonobetainyl-CoA:carnitine CoA-transferase CaiB-like acyl-CoA transferase
MRGVRVIELSRVLAGPWACQHLADQGADVIKIEPPGGDETRRFAPVVGEEQVSTYFLSCNRNKRSIVLDLRAEAGREVALALIGRADVLVHNLRPGAAERLGVGWDQLRPLAPRLVYVSIAAFGSDTPWATRAGYDLVLQAMGGAMSFTGSPGQPPTRAGTPIADLVAGLLTVQAVLHGLLERERTGAGQRIEVNMMQAQAACLVYHATREAVTGEIEGPRGNAHGGLVPYDVYRCTDGWLAVACGNDTLWQRLRAALALEDRPEWRTNLGRVADRAGVDAALSAALGAMAVDEADRRLAAAGVPVGPVLDVRGATAHPAVSSVTVDHPALGAVRLPGPVLRTATTRREHTPAPALGADRGAILAEAGYDPGWIGHLEARGAFGGEE